jgi:hypothetical protein
MRGTEEKKLKGEGRTKKSERTNEGGICMGGWWREAGNDSDTSGSEAEVEWEREMGCGECRKVIICWSIRKTGRHLKLLKTSLITLKSFSRRNKLFCF